MAGCHGSEASARRAFVLTPYAGGEFGILEPAMPKVGACFALDGVACVLWVHHMRERKTGPCFPVTVVECGTHGVSFTLYPPGHVPYGRARVAAVAPDGGAIVDGPGGAEAFEGTIFAAALAAAKGEAWDREHEGGSERWWGTQWRRLAVAQRISGVTPALGEPEREAMAAALGVTLLLLREQAQGISAAPGYRRRGQAVRAVLGALAGGPCVLSRLMAGGQLAGLWGAPHRWDPQGGQLRSLSFPGLGGTPRQRARGSAAFPTT